MTQIVESSNHRQEGRVFCEIEIEPFVMRLYLLPERFVGGLLLIYIRAAASFCPCAKTSGPGIPALSPGKTASQ